MRGLLLVLTAELTTDVVSQSSIKRNNAASKKRSESRTASSHCVGHFVPPDSKVEKEGMWEGEGPE